ncbi:MAG TPA: DUF1015 domain-containing protein [Candidatus Binatus sp.]|uniref:DUF1015 domain-containing protein n=1 Tax=Candidatus Binatus sp. TaxID=2811406 RepID=UPI002B475EA6|nr:DUF1015 domain-containing protein [Candidatus Binatus sp.]HKN14607.1 DUF1015 domain-containing protein [Candidatus Binatus sp.]
MSGLSKRIEPFRALMYNRQLTGEPERVVAPPYDLIGEARQNQLYERSPYNVVRLELGREPDRYGAAEKTLADWMAAGVVERSARPAIFQYTQTFDVEGRLLHRTGFIARVRLEEFDRGRVVPHERTFPAAKEDRLRLLTALQLNTSSIFGLYSGKHPELDRLRERVSSREPLINLVDDLGIRNELRPIEAADEIAIIQRELESPRILIADGHHRYETALNYRRARRHENPSGAPAPEPYDYIMMTLVACDDPGLVILPTHRVAKSLPPNAIASFVPHAREAFDVDEIAHRDEFRTRLNDSGSGAIGVALKGIPNYLIMRLRSQGAMETAMPDAPAEVRRLDVSVLHALVFDRIFGFGAGEIRKGGNIEYTIEIGGALGAVANGRADGAFLMNPPSIHDVERVSDAGATMPEKSTYFHPKLLTGLVMNPLFDGE